MKMSNINKNLPVHMSNRFMYDPKTRSFVADMSDLGGFNNVFARIYHDACDEGFIIQSCITGKQVIYVHAHSKFDNDGDFVAEYYEPTDFSKKVHPGCVNTRVVLYND